MDSEVKQMGVETDYENEFYKLGREYRACMEGGGSSFFATKAVLLNYLLQHPNSKITVEQLSLVFGDGRKQ